MSGSKRQRELARAKYERQQARRSANVDRRRRNQRIIAVVVVVGPVVVVVLVVAVVVAGDEPAEASVAVPEGADAMVAVIPM